ncbi:diguanylate cyclase [Oceaniglobus roseus]|uniref:diguanylate cyclase n=1 Tax=Oceaniglobus roseus TaxID=1737570 RepID=UPI000C7F4922|nr:diguanylate cyclase [Kandeliimicrobium roseum]
MPGRILIADDVATNRIVLKVKLSAAGYHVVQCADMADLPRMARTQEVDLVILPPHLPVAALVPLCRRIKADPAGSGVPVLLLVAADEGARRVAGLEAGADEVLTLPFDDLALLARVRSLLRSFETDEEMRRRDLTASQLGFAEAPMPVLREGRVALVGTTPEQALGWKTSLRGLTGHRLTVLSRPAALAVDGNAPAPDLYCIAAGPAPGGAGLRLLSQLRSHSATRHAAVLTIHPPDSAEDQATALDLGANGVLDDTFDPVELALRINRQVERKWRGDPPRASVEEGLRLAATDPLTGLFNRRYADHHLGLLARQADTQGKGFAVLMLDIDNFKRINDTFGHATGDSVLGAVARTIRDNLRGVDLVARYGGEEFVAALPEASLPAARQAAERVRRRIAELSLPAPDGRPVPVTVSIGIAIGGHGRGTGGLLLDQADRALYRAKTTGRNRVCVAPTAHESGAPQSLPRGPLSSDLSSRSA